jgi:hypothetical protein
MNVLNREDWNHEKTGCPTETAFPTQKLKLEGGGTVETYIIPDDKKAEVLKKLYPFTPVPDLDEVRFDLHEEKNFRVGDYLVTYEDGFNYVVSPYYASSGGTAMDWMPASEMS